MVADQPNETETDEQDGNSTKNLKRVGLLRAILESWWREIKRKPIEVTGTFAAIVLACFAYFAWLDTHEQLIAGEGAFVFMEKFDFIADTSQQSLRWQFIPRWVNSGGTPTENMTYHVNWQSGQLVNGGYLTDIPSTNVPVVLGPKATTEIATVTFAPNTFAPNLTIWGWARYTDTVEGKPHISRFCYTLVGWQGSPNIAVGEGATPLLLPA